VSVDGEGAYVSVPGMSTNRISVFVEALGLKEFELSLHVRFRRCKNEKKIKNSRSLLKADLDFQFP
jgi:hypothetical protein